MVALIVDMVTQCSQSCCKADLVIRAHNHAVLFGGTLGLGAAAAAAARRVDKPGGRHARPGGVLLCP